MNRSLLMRTESLETTRFGFQRQRDHDILRIAPDRQVVRDSAQAVFHVEHGIRPDRRCSTWNIPVCQGARCSTWNISVQRGGECSTWNIR